MPRIRVSSLLKKKPSEIPALTWGARALCFVLAFQIGFGSTAHVWAHPLDDSNDAENQAEPSASSATIPLRMRVNSPTAATGLPTSFNLPNPNNLIPNSNWNTTPSSVIPSGLPLNFRAQIALAIQDLAQGAKDAAEGRLSPEQEAALLGRYASDPFHTVGQTLEIFDTNADDGSAPTNTILLAAGSFGLNPIIVTDFDHEVSIDTTHPSGVAFVYRKHGKIAARRVFSGLRALTYTRDRELVTFLAPDGHVFGINMYYAQRALFNDPGIIPVVSMGTPLNDVMTRSGSTIDQLHFRIHARGTRPISRISEHAILPNGEADQARWDAGSVLVFQGTGDEEVLLGVLDRNVITLIINDAYAAAELIASLKRQDLHPDRVARVSQLRGNPITTARADQVRTGLSHLALAALGNLQDSHLDSLGSNPLSTGPRDQFSQSEGLEWFHRLRTRAQQERAQLESQAAEERAQGRTLGARETRRLTQLDSMDAVQDYSSLIQPAIDDENRRVLHPNRDLSAHLPQESPIERARVRLMNFLDGDEFEAFKRDTMPTLTAMAAVAAAVSLPIAVHNAHIDTSHLSSPLKFGVAAGLYLYTHLTPDVMKDASYRIPLLFSSLSLTAMIPLSYTMGFIYSLRRGMPLIVSRALVGFRAWGAMSYPFWNYIIDLTRQPNARVAMAAGINPLRRIRPDSEEGRSAGITTPLRLGFSNPFVDSQQRQAVANQQTTVIEFLREKQRKQRVAAAHLACLVVGETMGIDPVILSAALDGSLDPSASPQTEDSLRTLSQIRDLLTNRQNTNRWTLLASQFIADLDDSALDEVVAQIEPTTPRTSEGSNVGLAYQDAFNRAKALATSIQREPRLAGLSRNFRVMLNDLSARILRKVGTFGVPEHQFLMEAVPTDDVAKVSWTTFWVDYFLGVWQIALFGGRADSTKPNDLAAIPSFASIHGHRPGFLWTRSTHLVDIIDQVIRAYAFQVPAEQGLVMMNSIAPSPEIRFAPIQNRQLQSRNRQDTLWSGLRGILVNSLDFHQTNYEEVITKQFVKRIATIQGSLAMAMFFRTLLGGQSVSQAFLGFSLAFLLNLPAYGWMWRVHTAGFTGYDNSIAHNRERLLAAQEALRRALDQRDPDAIERGFQGLSELYGPSSENSGESEVPLAPLRETLTMAQSVLSIPQDQRIESLTQIRDYTGALASLQVALDEFKRCDRESQTLTSAWRGRGSTRAQEVLNDARNRRDQANARLRTAYGRLVSQYRSELSVSELNQLSAEDLIEFSRLHPPFATAPNSAALNLWTLVVSVLTTHIGTLLYIGSQHGLGAPEMIHMIQQLGLFWGGLKLTQRLVINPIVALRDRVRTENEARAMELARQRTEAEARRSGAAVETEEAPSLNGYRKRLVQDLAERYRVSADVVRGLIPAQTWTYIDARFFSLTASLQECGQNLERLSPPGSSAQRTIPLGHLQPLSAWNEFRHALFNLPGLRWLGLGRSSPEERAAALRAEIRKLTQELAPPSRARTTPRSQQQTAPGA